MTCRAGSFDLATTFNATNPEALEWINSHAGSMLRDLSEEARAAVRIAVSEGFAQGVSPTTVARNLRSVVGLTERDAQAVMRYQLEQLTNGVSQDVAMARAERYAVKLTRIRTENIAITETATAQVEGQQQLWNAAVDQGFLKATQQKVWITADPCPVCAPMDGERVPIRESFSIPGPPAHPRCQCSVGLV